MPFGVWARRARAGAESFVSAFRGTVMGTSVVAYLLAFSRWGSYVHIPGTPVYVTDVMLVGTAVMWWRAGGRWALVRSQLRSLAFVLAVVVLALVRLVAGRTLLVDALRDAAPYVYAAAVLLPLAPRPADAAYRTYRVLRGALVVHLVLVTVTLELPQLVAGLPRVAPPGPDSQILSLRADFNCTVLAVLAGTTALHLLTTVSRRRQLVETGLLVWSLWIVLKIGSRAGLLALAAVVSIVAVTRLWPRLRELGRPIRIAIMVSVVAVLAFAAPRLDAVQRLRDTPAALGIGVDKSKPEAQATGTAKARIVAWQDTITYTNRTAARRLVGVGFGPDFLHDSGAATLLEGSTYTGVRAPHNYFLNTYARLGLLGLFVVSAACLSVLLAAVRLLRRRRHDLDLATTIIFVALLVAASLGVILESPFGAVPAFWSAGWILTRQRRGLWSDAIVPARLAYAHVPK